MSLKKLPAELLERIFRLLPPPSLKTVLQVYIYWEHLTGTCYAPWQILYLEEIVNFGHSPLLQKRMGTPKL